MTQLPDPAQPDDDDGDELPLRARRDPTFAGRYKVSSWKPLGSGVYADVGAIFCTDLDRSVAVKIYKKSFPEDSYDKIRREVDVARRLAGSKFIVQITTPFFRPRLAWVEMELIRGVTLAKQLGESVTDNHDTPVVAPMPFDRALQLGIALFEGLSVARRAEIAHRDIKPANLILPDSGDPPLMILDFGLSKAGEAMKHTASTFQGTPVYASPEAYSAKPTGPSGDIYSATITLYTLLTGKTPWQGMFSPDFMKLISIHKREFGPPINPRLFVEGLPRELDNLLMQGLAFEPEARPLPDQFVAALPRFLSSAGAATVVDAPVVTSPAPPTPDTLTSRTPDATGPRRHWSSRNVKALIAGGASVIAVAVGGTMVGRSTRDSGAPVAPATVPTAATAAPTAAPLEVELDGGALSLTNVSRDELRDLKLTVVHDGTTYTATTAGAISAGEGLLLFPTKWSPALPDGLALRTITLTGTRAGQPFSAEIHPK